MNLIIETATGTEVPEDASAPWCPYLRRERNRVEMDKEDSYQADPAWPGHE